ncbi:MAG: 3'-5' exonuclease, partial [Planctomycetota bacterium]
MQDRIYEYLKSQKTGATSNELVEQVLKIKGATSVISEKLIQTAIAGDHRFVRDTDHIWKIIEKGGTPLLETEFVLLSLLTIERVDKLKVIIEISAQKLIDDKITERFHTFVNPGSSVIPSIQLPADIAQEIKECGVSVEKAVRSLLNFIGDAVLVGYDISSSINQLNVVLNRSSENIETPSLCLKYLVKKLIPDLHPKSLNDVAAFFKLSTIDTRRTENEVFTISEIFSRCKELLEKQGVCTLEDALEFQYPNIEYVDFSKYAFDKSFLYTIPQKPGI